MAKVSAAESIAQCEAFGLSSIPRTHKDRLALLASLSDAAAEREAIAERRGVQGRAGRPASTVARIGIATDLAPLIAGTVASVIVRADAAYFAGLTLAKSGTFASTAAPANAYIRPLLAESGLDTGKGGNVRISRPGRKGSSEDGPIPYVEVWRTDVSV